MTRTLQLMSTLAVEVAFKRSILPQWSASGRHIDVRWNPTAVLIREVRSGERADAIIMIDESINELGADRIVRADTITPIAQAGFGMAVRAGTVRADISTPDAFRNALVSARAVAYSRTGASGIYFAELIQRLGIADAVNANAIVTAAGFTAEKLVSGEADLAIQQISELMSVDGVEVVGPFPGELQKNTNFSVGIFADAENPDLAEAFVAHLSTPAADLAYRDGGLTSRLALSAQ